MLNRSVFAFPTGEGGFVLDDEIEAFNEAHATAQGSRFRQPIFDRLLLDHHDVDVGMWRGFAAGIRTKEEDFGVELSQRLLDPCADFGDLQHPRLLSRPTRLGRAPGDTRALLRRKRPRPGESAQPRSVHEGNLPPQVSISKHGQGKTAIRTDIHRTAYTCAQGKTSRGTTAVVVTLPLQRNRRGKRTVDRSDSTGRFFVDTVPQMIVSSALKWLQNKNLVDLNRWSKSFDASIARPALAQLGRLNAFLDDNSTKTELARVRRWSAWLDRNIIVMDVGCRWGFADAWASLGSRATVVGFDPDASECERLRANYRGPCDVRYVPVALGATQGRAPLFVTDEPACSSLFEPDPTLTATMPELAGARFARTTEVELTTLDSSATQLGLAGADFLKLDTQGAELMVLQGAEASLRSTRALEVEVEFNPIYRGQPLFGDIDAHLRARGFVLWRLKNFAHYSVASARGDFKIRDEHYFDSRPVRIEAGGGQLLWGHAYFVRAELAMYRESLSWQAALRDACITKILGFHELSHFSIFQAAKLAPPEAAADLRDS